MDKYVKKRKANDIPKVYNKKERKNKITIKEKCPLKQKKNPNGNRKY